jgi:superfamily II DNA or RNA helicase
MNNLKLDVYSHGVRLHGYTRNLFGEIVHFLSRLELKEDKRLPRHQGGGMVTVVRKKFFGILNSKREIYIHRNHLEALLTFLKGCGLTEQNFIIEYIDPPKGQRIEGVEIFDHFVERDYQGILIPELAEDVQRSRKVDLATGLGKTFCSLKACLLRGERFSVMLAPKYFGLWIGALNDTFKTFKDVPGQYITVSGGNELRMVMQQALDGTLEAKAIIISNTTYRNYIEAYEQFGENIVDHGYLVPPQRFHELLGIGTQINDEFHEDLGLTFRIDCFTNIKKQLYLSATPFNGDRYVTDMVDVMLPPETYCTIPEPPKYINVLELLYQDDVEARDYLTPQKNSYNHARYEKMMLKKKRRLNTYFSKVAKVVDKAFVSDFEPGQKMLILCATVDFIQALTKYLKVQFPNVKIGHYVSGVPYDTVKAQDITVSTIKSAGTGVDIRNLRETLLLQAVGSDKDNIQILGRTRPLKDFPDVTPRLIYFTCIDIRQHRKYAQKKKETFAGRILHSRTMRL